MKFRAVARMLALAVTGALALSACTSDSDSGSGGGGSSGGGGDQTLDLAQGSAPGDFRIGFWTGGEATIFRSVYDTIVTVNLDGEVEPAIAESYEYNEDATQLTFRIREGMEFTDGTPVDAEAVVASLNASREGPATSQGLAGVTDVAATDESTVVLTLDAPDASLLAGLGGIAGAIGSPEVLDDPASQLNPIGSGAYTLDQDETVVGGTYVLKKNPDNWNADAYPFETVRIQVIADPTAVQNAMQSGQLDWASMSAEQAAAFDQNQFTIGESAPRAVLGFWLFDREGTVVPALADPRVRQAINLALDREQLAEALAGGSLSPTNQVVDPRGDAYSEELYEEQAFDLDAARDLMAEAGYEDGFSVSMPSVNGITTQFESPVAQQLGELNIQVNWEAVPFQEVQSRAAAGNYGMILFFNGFAGTDAGDLRANASAVFNPFNLVDPEFERLMDEANTAPLEEQDAAFRTVNEYVTEQAWYAPIAFATGTYVHSNDIEYTQPYISSQNVLPFQPA